MEAHQKIRKYREDNAISPADMAKRLDIAESTLRSIENGNRQVKDVDFALVIERETGIAATEFFPRLFEGRAA